MSNRTDRRWAQMEYDLYKRHNRPNGPYHAKCLRCGYTQEYTELMGLDNLVRRHAGVHGGLHGEHAEVVALDRTGRELWRHHALIDDADADPPSTL